MRGLVSGIAALILLDLALNRTPASFASNVLGPATRWLAAWMSPDVPLIPPARHGRGSPDVGGGWATGPGVRHPPPILGPRGTRPLAERNQA